MDAIPLDDFFPIKSMLNNVNEVKIRGKKFVSVVRCGECRHKCGEYDGYIYCDVNDVWHDPKWFCAEGEKKRLWEKLRRRYIYAIDAGKKSQEMEFLKKEILHICAYLNGGFRC